MRASLTVLAMVAAAALAPAGAHASRLYVQSPTIPTKAFYDAAPGEANELTVTYHAPSRGEVTVHDAGAVIEAVAPCEAVDEHTAHCPPDAVPEGYPGFAHVELAVRLGDGDDHLITDSGPDFPFGSIVASGGKGDDVLAGDKGGDRLDGGGGSDRLSGGDGPDFLSDGDRSGQSPQPDVLDAGTSEPYPEADTVSYEHRTAGVTADLAHGVGGEPGEGDTLIGFESAVGGAGDDRITGGSEGSHLSGQAGDDTLAGGPGFNSLTGGSGDDTLVGGPGENELDGGHGLETYGCGRGVDHIVHPTAGELLGDLCDEVDFGMGEFGLFQFPPQPVKTTRRAVWFGTRGCPSYSESGDFEPCSALLKIRGGPGNRLLGRRAYEERKRTYPPPPIRVPLNREGRRLAARPRGVVATVSFNDGRTAVAWTIRLRTKR
jgi:hypothetical protein